MKSSSKFYVGVDWATREHAVCLTDAEGKILGERKVEHSGEGLDAMCTWLFDKSGTDDPTAFLVGIETPRGPVVETLLERGMAVHSINPKQSDRFRERYTAAGAKDDRRDARVIASAMRTDPVCFRVLRVDHPIVIELREWSRIAEDLQDERIRLSNRFRDQLLRYYPQLSRLASDVTRDWFLALWELVPTPAAAAKVTEKDIAKLLNEHKVHSIDASQVIAKLRETPLVVAPGVTEAARGHIAVLVTQLRSTNELRKQANKKLTALCDAFGEESEPGQKNEQRDVEILRSLPGVGRIVLATLLAEASQLLSARNYQALRNLCGVAPVTQNTGVRSGVRSFVVMRKACNARLREAVFHWAEHAVRRAPKSKAAYAALRARGQSRGRALRSIADRLLSLACAMLRDQTLYNPNHPIAAIA